MKSYTDLEQSKKLAEILPIESADMKYGYIASYEYSDKMYDGGYDEIPYPKDFLKKNPNFSENDYDGEFPAWSLAALLDILPPYLFEFERGIDLNVYPNLNGRGWHCSYMPNCTENMKTDKFKLITSEDNLIDACVEMIIKLHEQKLL